MKNTERLTNSMQEAAERLCISKSHLHRLVDSGKIPSIRVGRRKLIPVAALERFVDEQTANGYTKQGGGDEDVTG